MAASRASDRPGSARHGARATHAEHLGEEPLLEEACVRIHAVAGEQQPTGAALLDAVKAIARCALRNLTGIGLRMAIVVASTSAGHTRATTLACGPSSRFSSRMQLALGKCR